MGIVGMASLVVGCAPKVVVLDRQTVLQSEATGEFPDLETRLQKRAMNTGPKMVDRTKVAAKRSGERNTNVLNGELAHEASK